MQKITSVAEVSLQASMLPPNADHSDRLPAALTIRSGGMEVSVPGHGPAAYPTVEIASDVEPHSFRMAGHVFWSVLEATREAISTEETRYYLNGLYMHQPVRADDSNEIAFVATDGHRLNRQFFDLPAGAAGMPGVIIPRKAVEILHKLSGGDHPDLVEIDVTAQRGCFAFGNVSITNKMVDGTFPDYERVVPVGNKMEIRVSSPELLQTIDGLAAVLPRGAGRIQIDTDEGAARCRSATPMVGRRSAGCQSSEALRARASPSTSNIYGRQWPTRARPMSR